MLRIILRVRIKNILYLRMVMSSSPCWTVLLTFRNSMSNIQLGLKLVRILHIGNSPRPGYSLPSLDAAM